MPDEQDVLSASELAAVPIVWIEVRKKLFRLDVFRRPTDQARFFKPTPFYSCRIAVGAIGFGTPSGRYFVLDKSLNPSYVAPDSDWAREAGYTPGQEIPGGDPANPILGAWLRLNDDGIGIHGTANLLSLGTRASHGCVRVNPKAARRLYEITPVGSPVRIF